MIDLLINIGVAASYTAGLVFTAFKMQQQKRGENRAKVDKKHAAIAKRADRDHTRTLRGDPRGMYGDHSPPPEFVEVADDDQFIDEWDVCELCPQRGGAVHPGKPVAVWEGERLCQACYRERAYGNRLVDLPVPMPANYREDCEAWLAAKKEWESQRGDNVADFDEARQRLGRQMRETAAVPPASTGYHHATCRCAECGHRRGARYAVGKPEPAARTQAALTNMVCRLAAIGVPMADLYRRLGEGLDTRMLEHRCGFGHTLADCPHLAIPGHREFGHGIGALGPLLKVSEAENAWSVSALTALRAGAQDTGCDGCEKVYKHGSATPARSICTGNCE